MLNEILEQRNVQKIINIIKNSSEKENQAKSINYKLFANKEKVLFIFYDALFKYKVIIDDNNYFDDYLEQIDKLLKKITDLDDLTLGINKIICNFICVELNIRDYEFNDRREEILNYVYDKYIVNGYFIHGFSSCYYEAIQRYGFDCSEYVNFYADFEKVNEIFNKYNINNIFEKDFSQKDVTFTDNFVKACYYSANSPGYFYNLLYNREYNHLRLKKDILLKGDFDEAFKNLKKILNYLEISDSDKSFIIEVFKKEWNLLFTEKRKIALLLVKKSYFPNKNDINLTDLINNKNIDIYEAVDKILSERNANLKYKGIINTDELEMLSLEGLWEEKINLDEDEDEQLRKMEIVKNFQNAYGNISSLILVGAIFISLGVIISIILMIGG